MKATTQNPKTPKTETTKTLTTKERLDLLRKERAEEEKLLEELLHKEEIEALTLKLKKEAQENLKKETEENHNTIENEMKEILKNNKTKTALEKYIKTELLPKIYGTPQLKEYTTTEIEEIYKPTPQQAPKTTTTKKQVQTANPNEIYEGVPVCLCRKGKRYCGVPGGWLCEEHKVNQYKKNKKLKIGWWGCFGENAYGFGDFGKAHNEYMETTEPQRIRRYNRKTEDLRPAECIEQYPLE